MAEPEPRDERTNLTRTGLAARRARARALRGDRQARADLDARWAATQREDPSAPSVPLIQSTQN